MGPALMFAAASCVLGGDTQPEGPPPSLHVDVRVETGIQPKSVSAAPDGRHIAVCNFGQSSRRNVVLLRPDDLTEISSVNFEGTATESRWRSANTLLVSDFSRGSLRTIDVPTATVVDTVKVGPNPKGIALSADGTTAFVTNWSGQSVSVVDLENHTVVDTIKTGRRPRGVAVLEGDVVTVGAMWDHRVEVFAPHGRRWRGAPQIRRVCSYPRDVHTTPDGAWLVFSCSGNRRVRWFDAQTRRFVGQAFVGANPRSLSIASNGQWAAVANFHGSSVSLVDLRNGLATTSDVPDTDGIVGIAVHPGPAPVVFATSWRTGEVVRMVPPDAAQWSAATSANASATLRLRGNPPPCALD